MKKVLSSIVAAASLSLCLAVVPAFAQTGGGGGGAGGGVGAGGGGAAGGPASGGAMQAPGSPGSMQAPGSSTRSGPTDPNVPQNSNGGGNGTMANPPGSSADPLSPAPTAAQGQSSPAY